MGFGVQEVMRVVGGEVEAFTRSPGTPWRPQQAGGGGGRGSDFSAQRLGGSVFSHSGEKVVRCLALGLGLWVSGFGYRGWGLRVQV
jgi:hypothetical protein